MWPKTLRSRLIFLTAIAVTLPLLGSEYYTTLHSEQALILEKQRKLFGITRVLDHYLQGDYQDLLQKYDKLSASREEQISFLNQRLRSYTDQVAASHPGVGVGYYSRDLDAIITYGPSDIYHDRVGTPISPSHEGRLVMQTGGERVQIGDLVRGPIMNAMLPIIRKESVVGYIWANELTADIQAEIDIMKKRVYLSVFLGILLSLLGVGLLTPEAMDYLCRYAWPGNVRELANTLERAVVLARGVIQEKDLLPLGVEGMATRHLSIDSSGTLKEILHRTERSVIIQALQLNGGNRLKTAEMLGISRRALFYKIDEHKLTVPKSATDEQLTD
ncbi:helix-turn-helix domain-containing protein [Acetonema longum]|uniref:Sensory histidine kinase AtoS n=1 Tax=Acetonema longum DSM 6540 TaxID=1009370 RepID=F7NMT5_9FIRM|nr:helix-turn-helix domain-containing protein [Acetonema longum]EGO62629.1 sensory histidine kinase AtoS [Acetonema longum DSM 6540]